MDLNVLIVGGGIHGIGLLHDLSTRGIQDVHLVEKNQLASGTSSRSTKLVHGGLRYLEHLSQWGLVYEALHERTLLLKLLPKLVKPLPFVFPHFKSDKRPAWLVNMGISLYDILAGDGGVPPSRRLKKEEILTLAPYLNKSHVENNMTDAFLYYDGQMQDDVIARLISAASEKLGNTYSENTEVQSVQPLPENKGFRVKLKTPTGIQEVTTKYIVNATGPWANQNLIEWGFVPTRVCLLNLGTHLVFNKEVTPEVDIDKSCATILQEPDGRVVFFVPWWGRWLMGTTESILPGSPDHLKVPKEDKEYLFDIINDSFYLKDSKKNLDESFCGVRCMPLSKKIKETGLKDKWKENPYDSPFYMKVLDKNISSLSRETIVEECIPGLISIYGGKWTTYRAVSEKIGRNLREKLNIGRKSGTHLKDNWFYEELLEEKPDIFVSSKDLRQA